MRSLILLLCSSILVSSCKIEPKKKENSLDTATETLTKSAQNNPRSAGSYVSEGYEQRNEGADWVSVSVQEKTPDQIVVKVRSRSDRKKPTCTLDLVGHRVDENTFYSHLDGKKVLITFDSQSVNIDTENPEDSSVFYFYCSGGATVAGTYTILSETLDRSQIDPTIFSKVLRLQDIGFNVSSAEKNGRKTLSVKPFGLELVNDPFTQNFDGSIIDAQVEDLNADGSPELIIFIDTEKAGKQNVIGFSVNNKKSMSPIYFPPISDNPTINKGYEGNDEFALVERFLIQRFPVAGTDTLRQINYQLAKGENSSVFEVVSVDEIPK